MPWSPVAVLVVGLALGSLGAPMAPAGAAGAGAPVEPPAPPLASAEGAPYTGVAHLLIEGASCTGSLLETGVDAAAAYVLTNGHCAGSFGAGANDVIVDRPESGTARFGVFTDDLDGLVTFPVAAVAYSTMKGLDLAVVELAVTLGEARRAGVIPLAIADHAAAPGDSVVNVGIPVQGLDQHEWVLRRGECRLGQQVELIEFVWHFEPSWSNDCPGIRGGSSGSPVLATGGSIVAVINTGAGAETPGGDCYLDEPCEVGPGGAVVVAGTAYAVPVAGLDRCFSAGVFDLARRRCPLDPGRGVTVQIDSRAIRPDAATAMATTTAVIDGPPVTDLVTKVGAAGTTDCRDAAGYGAPAPLAGPADVAVTLPGGPGDDRIYLFCAASLADLAHAAAGVIQVDATPPALTPELSIQRSADGVRFEPIFVVPELADFVVKFGPVGATDCGAEAGYVRYRRIPFDVSSSDLPITVCVVGFDEAGNPGRPMEQTIDD